MKALVIFHRVDYDGLFGNAIATRALTGQGYEVEHFGYNYRDDLSLMPELDQYDRIVLTDISLDVQSMLNLYYNYKDKVEWIDHHITAINDSFSNGYNDMKGVRVNGTAASKLTWLYFFPDEEVPYAVDLVANYDVWNHDVYDWDNEILAFQYGLGSEFKMDVQGVCDGLDSIINNVMDIQKIGSCINKYMADLEKSWCSRFAFEVTVDGKWHGVAMLSPMFGSTIFQSLTDKNYDCYVVMNKSSKEDDVYNISMYSDKEGIELNCGEYMKAHFNGGGHKGAAGGTMTAGEFMNVITNYSL